jgi:UDP:flavonoid glycosyltransferase YjiC (YdhE family)
LQPDVLLIDEELPEIIIRATSLNVPMRLVQYFGGTRWRPGLPPLSSHLVPDGRLRTRFQIEVVWLALWVKRCLTHLLAPLFYAGTDRRSIIQAIAAQTGFDYSLAEFHHWFPMTFPNIPTLTLAAPEFDFAPMTTTGEEYVGPMVWTDRVDAMDSLTAAELEAFLIQNKEQKRPLIYCSLGTFWQMDLDFLQRVVAAFQQRPEWDLVLASGPGMEMDHFAPLPDNVVVYKRVPQLTVLEQADVVLTHGGIGTINECITFGVPMVVYSTGKLDQNGNAARILFHNLGLRGKIDETPSSISTKIAEILEKPRFRANVERMQTIYGRYQTDNRAVELIESLLP